MCAVQTKGQTYLVVDTVICTEGLDPIALLLTTGDTDDSLTSNNVLGNLNKDGSDGTDISISPRWMLHYSPSGTGDNDNVLLLQFGNVESTEVGGPTDHTDGAHRDELGVSLDGPVRQVNSFVKLAEPTWRA